MREYGWNLGDNTNKDFADVYDTHYKFINNYYYYITNFNLNKPLNINYIILNVF